MPRRPATHEPDPAPHRSPPSSPVRHRGPSPEACSRSVGIDARMPDCCEDGEESQMRIDDMILVSIDDHVIEPRDMFERHVPDKYKDDAPRVVKNDKGVEQWLFQGATAGSMGLNAVVT